MSNTDFLHVFGGLPALCRGAVCKDCKEEDPKMIMISNHLWLTVCDNKKDILCKSCIEVRLSRKLDSLEISMTYVNIVNWFNPKWIFKSLEKKGLK